MNHNLAKHKVTLELSKDYCDRCHKAIAVSESRVIWLQKKYHKDCFEIVKNQADFRTRMNAEPPKEEK